LWLPGQAPDNLKLMPANTAPAGSQGLYCRLFNGEASSETGNQMSGLALDVGNLCLCQDTPEKTPSEAIIRRGDAHN